MAKIIVTGSKGFIGSHLVTALNKSGHHVEGFDIREHESEDITVAGSFDSSVKAFKPDYIFHLAALKSVPFSFLEPYKVMETNGLGTLRVLEAAKKYNVKKVIYSSSSSIYGGIHDRGYSIEADTPNPLSPYAISKLSGEYYCKIAQVSTVSLRYFNVFGIGQQTDSAYAAVIPKFIKALIKGQEVELHGTGHQARDFTYVSDVVAANVLAMKSKETGTFNVACGESHNLLDMISELQRITGKKLKTKLVASRQGDILMSQASILKAKSLLGYQPKVDFKTGLIKMVEWMRKQA